MSGALRPSYDGLRAAQQKEIDDAFASAEKPAPTRMTRSAAAAFAAKPPAAPGADNSPTPPVEEIDLNDCLEAVDVQSKIPKDFCDKLMGLPKWTEKKEMLDVLIEKVGVPKIAPGDFHEIVKMLKKLMGDSMVVLVASAVTATGLLARGLRKDFSQYAKILLSTLLDRLKEKDFRVKDALHVALEHIIGSGKSLTLPDVLDDFCTALGPKGNPKAKVEIYKFLKKSIDAKANPGLTVKGIKPLIDVLVKGADDSTPEVRDGSCTVLGALLGALGADSMKKVLETLDEKKRKKIEAMAGAEGAAAADPAPPAAKMVAKKAVPKADSSSSAGAKKTAGKVAVVGKAAGPPKAKAAVERAEANGEVDLNAGMPVEELDAQAETLYAEPTRTKMSSSNWKERLEGMDEVLAVLQEQESFQQPTPDATVRMLVGVLVNKKETNFQVMAKGFAIVQLLSEKSVKFSKRAAHWMVPALVEKLGDIKLKTASSDCLLSLAESCTPNFMMSQGIGALEKQKAPKILENGLVWIKAMFTDFGMSLVKPKPVLEFVKKMLEVANPAVKKAAIEVLVTMRRMLGPDLRNMLTDVKPALLTSIDDAFSKVADEAPVEAPKRQVRCEDATDVAAAGGGDEIVSLTAPISAHLKALGDSNWKERQAAITAIDEIVSKAKPLGCQGPYMEGACGELWAGLKARLKDSNKNLAIQVLALLGKIGDAVGPAVDKYARHVMPNMLALISDNKKTVRDAVIQCLSCWSKHITTETCIKYLPVALCVESPAGREDAFKWAADFLSTRDKSDLVDLSPILMPVMDGLVFRVAEVRNGAERCLAAIYECGGKQSVNNVLRDMKPAQLKGVKPICDKAERAAALATNGAVKEAVPACTEPVAAAPTEGAVEASEPDVEVVLAKKEKAPKLEAPEAAAVVDASVEEEHGKLLRCNRSKDVREKKYGKTKWVLDDAKEVEDLISSVKDQMAAVCDDQLHGKLFHKDFKKQVDGIKELTTFAADHHQEVIDNLDLLLRMSSLRMVQKSCNTSVLLAVLDLLKSLMELCVSNSNYLTEPEATVILPVLLQEIGSNNEGIRGQIRDVVKKTTQVYPASRIFSFALDAALGTRNQRSRAEILAEMASLVDRLGLDQVCVPSKALPLIAGFIAERDSMVRNSACDCIAAAYSSIGEKIWKYIDKKLEPKDKDILEARLRKVKNVAPAVPASKSDASDMRRSMPEIAAAEKAVPSQVRSSVNLEAITSRDAAPALETPMKGGAKAEVIELLQAPTPTISNIRSRIQDEPEPAQPSIEAIFDDCLQRATSGTVDQQIAGLRDLSKYMDQTTSKMLEGRISELAGYVQMVLSSLLADQERSASDIRLAKHAIHAMHSVVTRHPSAAFALKDSAVGRLLEESLLMSIDASQHNVPGNHMAGLYEDLIKGLDAMTRDMLSLANPNHCFTSFIRFLYEGATLSGDRAASADFVDACLRCLLEMAKNMQAYMPKLDVDMLLYDCHMFLVSHPPSKYRGKEFRPLRLLKTILNELVKIKGEDIRVHLSLVPLESKPTLCSYIELVLQQHLSARAQPTGDKTADKQDIASIFDKIGSKDKDMAKEVPPCPVALDAHCLLASSCAWHGCPII